MDRTLQAGRGPLRRWVVGALLTALLAACTTSSELEVVKERAGSVQVQPGAPAGRGGAGDDETAVVAPVPPSQWPADRVSASDAPCAGTARPAGWLVRENARGGSPLPAAATGKTPVYGYLEESSAVCGDVVRVHLSGPARTATLVAYRLGWYGGAGSRAVWRSGPLPVRPLPAGAVDPVTHVSAPGWPVAQDITLDASWLPGMYVLVPMAGSTALGPAIPLVVRDDAGTEPLLYLASTLTWQAYNGWNGYSLYSGPGSGAAAKFAARARVVALDRPIVGDGLKEMWRSDLGTVRWLESLGRDVAYTTDVALDQRPSQLRRHAALVVGGHSEYWTTRMYDALQAAIADGVNVALLGANNVWWHTRLEDGDRREVVYRVLEEDPAAVEDPQEATVLWANAPFHRGFEAVTGQTHTAVHVTGGLRLVAPPSWLVVGTSLRNGSLLPGAVGGEADGYNPAARRPSTLQVLAAGVLRDGTKSVYVTTTYATASSGAAVFSAGSTYWACQLGGTCPSSAPAATVASLKAMSRNVVLAFAVPRAGATHPAQPRILPDIATYARGLPAAAVGRFGSGD